MRSQRDIERVRERAVRRFLGREHVVGVGLAGGGERLVFLLEQESADARATIESWARSISVPIEIRISGKLRAV